jgi:hypothetical protein
MLIEPTGACASDAFALALGGGVGVGVFAGVGVIVGATVALAVLVGDAVGALVGVGGVVAVAVTVGTAVSGMVGVTVALGSGVGACVIVGTGVGITVGVVVATIAVVADGVGAGMVDVATLAGGVAIGLLTVGAPNAGATRRRTNDAPSTIPIKIARVVIGIDGRWLGPVILLHPSLHPARLMRRAPPHPPVNLADTLARLRRCEVEYDAERENDQQRHDRRWLMDGSCEHEQRQRHACRLLPLLRR